MAGQPKKRSMIIELSKRSSEECDDSTAHLQYVCQWIESGQTMVALARDLSDSIAGENDLEYISREMLSKYLRNQFGPEADTKLTAARATGAHGIAERAVGILDDADAGDKTAVAKAKAQADGRFWLAERWNKADLGRQPDMVVVNNNTLHLDAMRARSYVIPSSRESDSEPKSPMRALHSVAPDPAPGRDDQISMFDESSAIEDAIVLSSSDA